MGRVLLFTCEIARRGGICWVIAALPAAKVVVCVELDGVCQHSRQLISVASRQNES